MSNINLTEKKDRLFRFSISTIIIYFGIVTLFSSNENFHTLYFKYNMKAIPIIILIISVFVISILNKNIFVDSNILFLLMRSVLLLIPYLYVENTYGYWGNYLVTLLSILTYLLVINMKIVDRIKFLDILMGFIGIVLTSQLIINSANLFFKYGKIYKHLIRIPIGNSNFIAAYLVPCFIYYLMKDNKKFIDVLLTFIFLMGIFLTYSKGAIFTLLLMAIIRVFLVLRRNKKINYRRIIPTIIIIILVSSFTKYLLKTDIGLDIYFNTIDKIVNNESSNLNNYTSGRIVVYKTNINRFYEHIFLGNGLGYKANLMNEIEIKDGRAHNWIIELLVQSGIVGSFIFLVPICLILIRAFKNRKSDILQFQIFLVVISILIHGLVEPNLFSMNFDVLFWIILGICETGNKDLYKKNGRREIL